MKRWGPVGWLLCLAMVVPLMGCPSGPAAKPGPVRVVTTIPPLAGLIRPLLPAGGTVEALIPPNKSEHGYELTANDIAALARADVVVYVGLGLDPQVESFLKGHPNPIRRDVCLATVARIAPADDDHDAADHHDDDGHHHGGVDPHLWLDPDLCIAFVPALQRAIDGVPGPGASSARADALVAQIKAFDAESRAKLSPLAGASIVTHHSAWGRFAAHYGLKVAAVIKPVESGEETPDAAQAAVKAIRDQGAKAIFIEPQFSPVVAQNIADKAGVKVGHLDPLGDGDWFKMMRANVDALAGALGG